jgi:hypothetical protein
MVPAFLQQELPRIAQAMDGAVKVRKYRVQYEQPEKFEAGDTVYADGVTWNPGAGEGLYRRSIAGAWVFIG